jgi:PRC-barrel domain
MLKRLMMTTAAAALVAGSALAQSPAPETPKAPPMQKSETMPAPGATGSRQFITMQSADQWLATKFKGTDVIGSNNEKIGDVADLLMDQHGRIVAYIVGVGGFLGIGQKDVALAPAAFQVQPATEREHLKLRLAMTRDELKNAPEFKPASSSSPTTGQAPPRDRTPTTPPAR